MNIGSFDGMKAADIAADLAASMPERVRSAHQSAGEELQNDQVQTVESTGGQGPSVDTVGAELRSQLEEIVSEVISADGDGPDDLLREVVDVVIADRIERSDVPTDEDYHDEVSEQMRNDPTVVAELDDILQTIARELALR